VITGIDSIKFSQVEAEGATRRSREDEPPRNGAGADRIISACSNGSDAEEQPSGWRQTDAGA
jgi:hypothetical protein